MALAFVLVLVVPDDDEEDGEDHILQETDKVCPKESLEAGEGNIPYVCRMASSKSDFGCGVWAA